MDSSWNLAEGKLPVKILSVNESDAGSYICHVIAPVAVSGSVELIICKYCSANYISHTHKANMWQLFRFGGICFWTNPL